MSGVRTRLAVPALVVAMLGALGALLVSPLLDVPAAAGVPHLPWPALVVALALAEVIVVHVEIRREAHTFGAGELALAVGLLAAGGRELVTAEAVGVLLALLWRRQTLVKLAFNVAQYALSVACAVPVVHALAPAPRLLDAATALAVLAGLLVASSVGFVLITAAIGLVDRVPPLRENLDVLVIGYAGAAANAGLGLSLLLLASEGPLALLCAAPAVAAALASYRAYVHARQRREHLALLLAATQTLQRGGDDGDTSGGWSTVLAALQERVHAERATLLVAPAATGGSAGEGTWLRLDVATDAEARPRFRGASAAEVEALLVPGASALVAAIRDEDRLLGHLLVGPRLGPQPRYAESDRTLVEALANQVGGALETGRLEQALAQITALQQRMAHEATHDGLTGLANRTRFTTALEEALAGPGPAAVVLVDLDDFKAVNDQLGHAAGDELLRAVADRLREVVRAEDTPARLGGDEFAVVLPDCSAARSAEVAARLVEALAAPVQLGATRVAPRASIGTAARDGEPLDLDELVRRADVALYQVKRNGKAGHQSWRPGLRMAGEGPALLSSVLPAAVADGEFVCHYQPLVDLETGASFGLEALVRWQHPQQGLLLPAAFLGAAEDSGLIRQIGEQVLRAACREVVRLQAQDGRDHRLHVNISPAQMDAGLPHLVALALHESGLAPDRLVLEVTEGLALSRPEEAAELMRAVGELGVTWALDDFGTGYAALDRLVDLPVSLLKIPRQLVRGVATPRGARLLSGTLALAREMGLEVVAEGVEQQQELDALLAGGITRAQGHLWSTALDPVALGPWLRSEPRLQVPRPRR
ncbi:diguanylate cyclase (GGDEF)-like protein [Motilibacter rhizosphaerae]|uniref:Diguanylate cyclase (GGDEF)-like protein n=1 Tax=Motilibacter rhizosphaerae TaxID=598652 RepID=A0A4Q7NTE6_9ACTN|nr:EAL domain-containing protein [Motilibacter rhizosphaerae]RZS90170.1 diguanylate cyclase (GGDEF)-like protein [Motilibacter rhizosphaerae]